MQKKFWDWKITIFKPRCRCQSKPRKIQFCLIGISNLFFINTVHVVHKSMYHRRTGDLQGFMYAFHKFKRWSSLAKIIFLIVCKVVVYYVKMMKIWLIPYNFISHQHPWSNVKIFFWTKLRNMQIHTCQKWQCRTFY